jgi:hypothetical protein
VSRTNVRIVGPRLQDKLWIRIAPASELVLVGTRSVDALTLAGGGGTEFGAVRAGGMGPREKPAGLSGV